VDPRGARSDASTGWSSKPSWIAGAGLAICIHLMRRPALQLSELPNRISLDRQVLTTLVTRGVS